MNKKSEGILVLGIMAIICSLWSLLHYFRTDFIYIKNLSIYSQILESKGRLSANLCYISSIISLLGYLLLFICGVVIIKLKNWARIALIITSSILLITTFSLPYLWARFISGNFGLLKVPPNLLTILYSINIWFFSRKATKEQFKEAN